MRLYLNDTEVIIDPSETVVLSKAANDIGQFQKSKGEYSNSLKVLRTPEMDAFFGFPSELTGTFETVYQRFKADIETGGADVLRDGFAFVEEVDETHYTIQVLSGNFDLYNRISGKELQDLNLRDLDHRYTAANVNARRNATTGICYPDINYGNQWDSGSGTSHQNFDKWRPAVYVRTLVEYIIEQAGFTVNGDSPLFDIEEFNEMILPQCGAFKRSSKPDRGNWKLKFLADASPGLNAAWYVSYDNSVANDYFPWFDFSSGLSVKSLCDYPFGRYRATIKINVLTTGTLTITVPVYTSGANTYNFTTTGSHTIDLDVYGFTTTLGGLTFADRLKFQGTAVFSYQDFELAFTCERFIAPTADLPDARPELFRVADNSIAINSVLSVDLRTVEARGLMPKMKQSELLKYVYASFGVIQTISEDGEATLSLINQVPINPQQELDIDLSERPIFKPHFGDFAQENQFNYQSDNKDPDIAPNPTLGRGIIRCDYKALDASNEAYEAPFAPASAKEAFDTHKVFMCSIPINDDLTPKVIRGKLTTTGNKVTLDGYGVPASWIATSWEGLSYSDLIPNHYGRMLESLQLPMMVECKLRLDFTKYKDFDFTRPLYNSKLNALFWVNEIEEFNPELPTSTTFKLIVIR